MRNIACSPILRPSHFRGSQNWSINLFYPCWIWRGVGFLCVSVDLLRQRIMYEVWKIPVWIWKSEPHLILWSKREKIWLVCLLSSFAFYEISFIQSPLPNLHSFDLCCGHHKNETCCSCSVLQSIQRTQKHKSRHKFFYCLFHGHSFRFYCFRVEIL